MRPSPGNDPGDQNKYDIFREESDKQLVWLEVITGLEEAKKRLMSLASTSPNRYRVYDSSKATFIELSHKKSA
jgi:hypothetical protein